MPDINEFNYPHLVIESIPNNKDRYKPKPGDLSPPSRNRKAHSKKIKKEIDKVKEETFTNAETDEIDPRLIYKIEYSRRFTEDDLRRSGCRLLGELKRNNEAQVVFSDQSMMEQFLEKWDEYTRGELTKEGNPQYRGFFENINKISRLEPEDRMGPKLRNILNEGKIKDEEEYWVDLELWYRSSKNDREKAEADLKKIIDEQGIITDTYIGRYMHLLRAKISGKLLKYLLEKDIICQIDLPPKLSTIPIKRMNTDIADIKMVPPEDDITGICIIDSGINNNHILLENIVEESKSFRDDLEHYFDENGHGTFVAGIAAYGNIEECIDNDNYTPAAKLYNARLTDKNNDLGPDDKIYIKQIKNAIEYFNDKYSARIFNVSLGDPDSIYINHNYQSKWAHILDRLARKRDLILVISSGNINQDHFQNHFNLSGEEIVEYYPNYLFQEKAGLLDPGTATNCLTVGSIATELKTSRGFINTEDKRYGIRKLKIASRDQPSPFTRSGLGFYDTIKPEFITYGGNMYYDSSIKQLVCDNPETGVFSLNYDFVNQGRLFSCGSGTSYAAPYISHLAARILNYDNNFSNNTVRALLSNSSYYPEETERKIEEHMETQQKICIDYLNNNYQKILEEIDNQEIVKVIDDCLEKGYINKSNKKKLLNCSGLSNDFKFNLDLIPGYKAEFKLFLLRLCGYGVPDLTRALYSSERRVTMYAEDRISVDKFNVYQIPVPEDFKNTKGSRKYIISLAYNPPTRHTRQDYCAFNMNFELIRGKNLDEILKIASNDTKKEKYSDLGATRCDLLPKKSVVGKSTLQKRVFEAKRATEKYGNTYYLVVESQDNWINSSAEFSDDENFDYSVVITLEHSDEEVEIYNEIKERIEIDVRPEVIQRAELEQ